MFMSQKKCLRLLCVYIGLVSMNATWHACEYFAATKEQSLEIYGPNLRKMWKKYSSDQASKIFDKKNLIPFSAIDIPYEKPLKFRNPSGTPVIIDIDPESLELIITCPEPARPKKETKSPLHT